MNRDAQMLLLQSPTSDWLPIFFNSLVISGNRSPFSFRLYVKHKTKFVNKCYNGENKRMCCPGVPLCEEWGDVHFPSKSTFSEITEKDIYKTLLCYSRLGSNFQLSVVVSPPLASLLNNSWSPASDIIWSHSCTERKSGISEMKNRERQGRSLWAGACNSTIFLSRRFHRPIYF